MQQDSVTDSSPTLGKELWITCIWHTHAWVFKQLSLKSLSNSQGYTAFALSMNGFLSKPLLSGISSYLLHLRGHQFLSSVSFPHTLTITGKTPLAASCLLPPPSPFIFSNFSSLVPQLHKKSVTCKWFKLEPNFWQLPKRHKPVNSQVLKFHLKELKIDWQRMFL